MDVYDREKQKEGFSGWWNSEKISRWDKKYDNYDVHTMRYLNSRQEKVLELVDSLNLPKGAKVLELGYGAGQTALKLVERGFEVHGVDISEKLCEISKQRCHNGYPDGTFDFTVGNIEAELKYADEEFDVVVLVGALQYVYDYNACLQQVRRVLKPEGHFVIAQFNSYSMSYWTSLRGLTRTLTYFLLREELEFFPSFKAVLTDSKWKIIFGRFKDYKFMNSKFMLKGHDIYKFKLKKKIYTYHSLRSILKKNGLRLIKSTGAYYPFSEKKLFWDFNIKFDAFMHKYLSWAFRYFARNSVHLCVKNKKEISS